MTQDGRFFHRPAEINAAHFLHHQIADDSVRLHLSGEIQSLRPVGGFQHPEVALKDLRKIGPHLLIVVDDQHHRTF